MMVYLQRDGQQFGPYPVKQVREMLSRGEVLPTDHAWTEGAVEWVPVSDLPGLRSGGGNTTREQRRWGLIIAGASVSVVVFAGVLGMVSSKSSKNDGDKTPTDGNANTITPSGKPSTTGTSGAGQTFAKIVSPILERHMCYECHNLDKSGKAKADLDFSNPKSVKSFATPNSIGFPGSAPLVLAVSRDAAKRMPPKGPPLTTQEINLIKGWIKAGLKF